jgi:hypothetical protein
MNKPITKQSFKKINLTISIALAIVLFIAINILNFAVKESKTFPEEVFIGLFFLIIPGVFLAGIIWFLVSIIRYYQSQSGINQSQSFKKIGAVMGLIWFGILVFFLIAVIMNLYEGNCIRFLRGSFPCDFATYLVQDFGVLVISFYGSWFIAIPIILLIIGAIADYLIKQKAKQ